MTRRTSNKTNPRLVNLISLLKDTSRQNEVNIWRDVAVRLEAPARNYAEVNLSKINRYASNGEIIVVPGKVLGSGMLEMSVKIAALTFSQSAETKIMEANGQCLTIEELVKDNPKGSKIRVLR
ncbi:MAG: 50S ribosomal protein L18e [Methanolinea sp.]|jgi:large subunit ribosomal protein L18e|nr:50S ribosomal protein L18e [Methanolinea sp.]